MKKIYLLSLMIVGFYTTVEAQTPCDAGRYSTEIFSTVDVTSGVVYGANTTFTGSNQSLVMDIYQPAGDTELERPLIIWVHGGSFIGGSKTDADVVALSQEFAKRGYVCASIDYRVGMWPIDSVNAIKAVIRAVHDLRGATRYFYKDRATTNTYKIDTTKIFVGGSSAGAVTSLHHAYFDKECEVTEFISLSTLTGLGGVEGTSGNPGYSHDVQGVINLCGAMASYAFIESGDIPMCSMHGNNDGTVPYNRDIASVSGFGIMYLDGSRVIDEHANNIGIQSNFYTFTSAGHVPYYGNNAYMDTTVNFVSDFLVDLMGCSVPVLLPENTPQESVTLYTPFICGLSTSDLVLEETIRVYPNPSENNMTISFDNDSEIERLEVIDLFGRTVKIIDVTVLEHTLSKSEMGAGTFILRITNANGVSATRRVVFQ